jgi:hypothetical protein
MWKDPNLSAAFLTTGNLVVLLLVLSGNALSWVLFALVFGVLPLGLAARLTGADKSFRESLTSSSGPSSGSSTPSYYETHVLSQLTTVGLIRLGVYLVILANIVGFWGIPASLLLIGNAAMLLPLGYMRYQPIVMQQIKIVRLDKVAGLIKGSLESLFNTIAAFGPMAPAVFGGLLAFIGVIISSYVATSTALLVGNMRLAGYAIILTFAVVPPSLVEKTVTAFVPSPAVVEKIIDRVQLNAAVRRVSDLILWENYKNSVLAFASLYGFYFVSKFIGVIVPVALGTGLFVAFTLTPSTLKEKAFAEIDKTIQQVRESVTSRISLTPPLPEKEQVPVSPKSNAGGSPKHKSPKKKQSDASSPKAVTSPPKPLAEVNVDEHYGE